MSKKLTSEDKMKFVETSLVKLTEAEKKIVLATTNIDTKYSKLMRYLRIHKDSNKQEQKHLLDLATKYRHILEGLDCIDQKLWTDEKKIKEFTEVTLEDFCQKGVRLVEENNRRHLERLRIQREKRRKEYEAEQTRYDREIAELEKKMGYKTVQNTVVTEVSLNP